MWFGGQSLHPPLLRRIVRYGSGFHPFGAPTDADMALLADAMRAAGRDVSELELIGGIRGRFDGPDAVADLDEALAEVPGAARPGLHLDLLQAVDVHRRPRRGRPRCARASSRPCRPLTPTAEVPLNRAPVPPMLGVEP